MIYLGFYLYFCKPDTAQSKEIQLDRDALVNFSAAVRSISLSAVCQNISRSVIHDVATVLQSLWLLQGEEGIREGFNKDDGMEGSISGAGLGQVFQL